ncbi:imidazole glycerol phosphate synthase subunit HisH [Marinivivus vitaminiproducens]|uniref:imidazole glycerol phosphate synthase subunit HisH n=1 Tax=Marinivivus vitaminiproducens TaxID=3035935 RepID=UPI0027A2DEF5|nr:imidazole glycerol phosphate synthase subunit HisH [Geminicoccaceae bacterium SCSIO 64248]
MSRDVLIVPTGTANLASVQAAFRRLGALPRLAEQGVQIEQADHVVVPGVGTFGASMARLRAAGFEAPLRARLQAGRPTLGFCVGLQVMCAGSDESPGATGLGLVPSHVGRFPDSVRTPQFGWNVIAPDPACRILQPGYAYFANSFRVAEPPPGCAVAMADHGGPFIAGFEKAGVVACQFHPELSGAYGRDLLARWLAA